jgi:SAM-dependent methyltransferase
MDTMTAQDFRAFEAAPPHERYQYKPFTGSSHSWALGECAKLPPTTRVLDIGCGSGAIGRELKAKGWQSLKAVEIDAAARDNARGIYSQIESPIEPFRGQKFDLILLLDVIEHMTEPEKFLHEASSLLTPGGIILVSVPNVAHWSVRLPLLFGWFHYTERGLLDRTHLQLFTRARVNRFTQSIPSLRIVSQSGSIEPAEFVLPEAIHSTRWFEGLRHFRLALARMLPGFFAFQHLVVLKKSA